MWYWYSRYGILYMYFVGLTIFLQCRLYKSSASLSCLKGVYGDSMSFKIIPLMRTFLLADFFHQWREETEAILRRGAPHQQVSHVVSAQDAAHGPNN